MIVFAISKLPLAKFDFQNNSAGPFHNTVLLNSILFIILIVFGPISKNKSHLVILLVL